MSNTTLEKALSAQRFAQKMTEAIENTLSLFFWVSQEDLQKFFQRQGAISPLQIFCGEEKQGFPLWEIDLITLRSGESTDPDVVSLWRLNFFDDKKRRLMEFSFKEGVLKVESDFRQPSFKDSASMHKSLEYLFSGMVELFPSLEQEIALVLAAKSS